MRQGSGRLVMDGLRWALVLGCVVCCSLWPVGCGTSQRCVGGIGQLTLDPTGSPCETQCDCNNQRYTGTCVNKLCQSQGRESCDVRGKEESCTLATSLGITCKDGIRTCGKDLKEQYWGDCIPRQPSGEETLAACRDGLDNDCDGAVDKGDPGCAKFCNPQETRPCYEGPKGTQNVGECKAGLQTCKEDGSWGECEQQVQPAQEDPCDGKDNNCDGSTDENCECKTDSTRSCYTGPQGTEKLGICRAGEQKCVEGKWSICQEETLPMKEDCNGKDDDCDGSIDESDNDPKEALQRACYTGPAGTQDVGTCKGGKQTCQASKWSACTDEQTPTAIEYCDGKDNDCDGSTDEGCDACAPSKLSERKALPLSDLNAIAAHPTKPYFAVGDSDGKIREWNNNGDFRAVFAAGHSKKVNGLAYHPSGNYVASASEDGKIHIWQTAKPLVLPRILSSATSSPVLSVAFHPNGEWIAAGFSNGYVNVWNIKDLSRIRLHINITTIDKNVHAVAFPPDPNKLQLAAASDNSNVYLFTLPTTASSGGQKLAATWTATTHTAEVRSLAFSPDGKTLATGSRDLETKLWDASTGTLISTLPKATSSITAVAFHPQGKKLVTCSGNGLLRSWDINTPSTAKLLLSHKVHSSVCSGVTYNQDGTLLLTTGRNTDATLRVWQEQSATLKQLLSRGHSPTIWAASISPDGDRLALGIANQVRLRNLSNQNLLQSERDHFFNVVALAFSPDGKTLISGSKILTGKQDDVIQWDGQTLKRQAILYSNRENIVAIAFSPDGKTLAIAHEKLIKLLTYTKDKNTWLTEKELTGHNAVIQSIAFSPDGKTLASGAEDKTIKLWDVSDASKASLSQTYSASVEVVRIAFQPDGKRLAAGLFENKVEIWNLDTHSLQQTLNVPGPDQFIAGVAYAKNSYTLAVALDNGNVHFWDTRTYQRLNNSIELHNPGSDFFPTALLWHPTQRQLLVTDTAGFMHFYTCP